MQGVYSLVSWGLVTGIHEIQQSAFLVSIPTTKWPTDISGIPLANNSKTEVLIMSQGVALETSL
jgi:hypothetical protein